MGRRSWGHHQRGVLTLVLVVFAAASSATVATARTKPRHHAQQHLLPKAPRGNVAVTPAGVPKAYNSPEIAVDPANQAHLAIAYYEASQATQCLLALSSNSGRTWKQKVVVGPGGAIPLASGTNGCAYPSIAYGPRHAVYYAYQLPESGGSQSREVWVATSRDGGAHFGAPVKLDSVANSIVHATVSVAVDQNSGRVYVAWTHETNTTTFTNQNVVASSTNDGRTFSAMTGINPAREVSPDEVSVRVGSDGTLYATWRDFDFGPAPDYLTLLAVQEVARSTNHGATFSPPVVALNNVDPGCGFQECLRPVEYAADNVSHAMALGNKPGQLYMVGYGVEGGGPTNQTGTGVLGNTSPRRLFFTSSSDRGRAWSKPLVVGIPPGNAGTDQARPNITVSPNGTIWIVYQDMPTGDGPGDQWIYEINSTDGGRTWSVPKQLNTATSSITVGPSSFSTFTGGSTANLGARLGIASTANDVFFAWTDTRRGTAVTGKQDIYIQALPHGGTVSCPRAASARRRP